MKKIFSGLLGFMIFLLLIILAVNLSVKDIVVDTLSDSMVKGKVSDIVTDFIYDKYPNISNDNLKEIEDIIYESDEVNHITDKYFNSIMDSIADGDSKVPEVHDELHGLIENNRDKLESYGISSSDIDKITSDLDNDDTLDEIYSAVSDNMVDNLTDEQRKVIDVYNFLSSDNLKNGLIIGIIGCLIIISFINQDLYSWLIYSGINTLVAGLVVRFVIINVINMVAFSVTNNVLGRTSDIDIGYLSNVSNWYMIVGVLFIIGYIVIDIIIKRKKQIS